jgi:hypothetical protein
MGSVGGLRRIAERLDAALNEVWTEIVDLEEEAAEAGADADGTSRRSERRSEMPKGDGTGPTGMGPMTGRAAGYCAGYGVPGFANAGVGGAGRGFGFGRGRGRGFGRGMGWRRGWGAGFGGGFGAYPMAPVAPAPMTAEDEAELLRSQAAGIQRTLDEINARLAELEKARETAKD